MKNIRATAALTGAVIFVFFYPFLLIHQHFGWIGLAVTVFAIAATAKYFLDIKKKKDQDNFEKLVLYTIHNRLRPEESQAILQPLYDSNFDRGSLIRNLQIIRDSIEISLASKKREVAESRKNSVLTLWQEVSTNQAQLVSKETLEEIARVVLTFTDDFNTSFYVNIASGHVNKAGKLKTISHQMKYIALAKGVLMEGMENPKSNKDSLIEAMRIVNEFEKFTLENQTPPQPEP